ncbi:MAG: NAD(P)/FAD-dependent oxidoreductase [Anaerolineae bacterium]
MNTNPDVIIIGSGIIGCAVAFEMSKAGYKTLNIDKLGDAGLGSTSNSCALVRLSYSTYDGIRMAQECFSYWKDWDNYLGAQDERGMAQFVNNGAVLTMSDAPNFPRMVRIFKELGIEFEVWNREAIDDKLSFMSPKSNLPIRRHDDPEFFEESGEYLDRLLFIKDGGYITDPSLATHNIMVAAQAHGGEFLFNAGVAEIRQKDGRVAGVTLEDGTEIDANIVVNVAGPHSGVINRMAGVEADMKIKTRPLRHEVHFVPNPHKEIGDLASHWSDADSGVYFRPETGGALLIGSKDPDCDPREWLDNPDDWDREVSVDQWKNQVYRLAKRLPELKIPNQPKGVVDLYDVTDDWIPIYDKSSLPGYYMAIGTSGNQFKNAGPVGYLMMKIIDAVEKGHDQDNDPIKYQAVYNDFEIDTSFYSRLREINPESSFSVSG